MHINAFFVTFHVTEGCQRRSSSCRICHACTAMQILQICFFPVGYDIHRQCIITPVKVAHGTLIQNIVRTSTIPPFQIVRLPEKAVEQMRDVKELEKEWKDETPESDVENDDEDIEHDSSSDEYEEQVETKGRNLTDGQLS